MRLSLREKLSKSETKINICSYWSFNLGFGSFLPLFLIFVFRKKKPLVLQLIQSFLFQSLFSLLIVFFLLFKFVLIIQIESSGLETFFDQDSVLQNLLRIKQLKILYKIINFLTLVAQVASFILFLLISVVVSQQKTIEIPLFYNWSKKIYKLFENQAFRENQKKIFFLNSLWPGLGNFFLGSYWLGVSLISLQSLIYFSLLVFVYAHFDFLRLKLFLIKLGFLIRLNDFQFLEKLSSFSVLVVLVLLSTLNYIVSFYFLFNSRSPRKANQEKNFLTCFNFSLLFYLTFLWSLILVPFSIGKNELENKIKTRAKEISKRLKQKETQKALFFENLNKRTKQEQPQFKLNFDLEIPNEKELKELNGFNPVSSTQKEEFQINYKKRTKPLPNKQKYKEKLKNLQKTKSYSEYISAKIREDQRDQLIWDQAPAKYSIVVEYTIETNGQISDISLLEKSDDLEIDALVVSVLKSMDPLLPPPKKQKLKITELFWNTLDPKDLNTEFKRSLYQYPDGRIIE